MDEETSEVPTLLVVRTLSTLPALDKREEQLLTNARGLFDAGFYDHALLDVWRAAVNSLRRRTEKYGVELFLSAVKDEPGRKKYDKDGDDLRERWAGVDELTLISGATRLGILNKKAGKSLEMINWMRNHASAAHDSEDAVTKEDVLALTLILQKNLFEAEMPDAGHSPSSLFAPVKSKALDVQGVSLLDEQIRSFRGADIRLTFGFMLDMLCAGDEPALTNVKQLLPTVWEKANEDLKLSSGARYHSFLINPDADDSADKGGKLRLLEFLTSVAGICFIPDAARASIYRRAAQNLAKAKDTSYGWADEEAAARTLNQFGPHVPSIAFEEVYQEILSVWCGNYWGHSTAHSSLRMFIDSLNSARLLEVANLFITNARVRSELFQPKPKGRAIDLLRKIMGKLTIEQHKADVQKIIDQVQAM